MDRIRLDGTTYKQTVICRQLLTDLHAGFSANGKKEKMHQMITMYFYIHRSLIVTLSLLTGVKPVFFNQWRKIDQVEQERGRKLGKPREKIISVQEMLDIAYKHEGS